MPLVTRGRYLPEPSHMANGLRTRVDQGPQFGQALTGASFGDPYGLLAAPRLCKREVPGSARSRSIGGCSCPRSRWARCMLEHKAASHVITVVRFTSMSPSTDVSAESGSLVEGPSRLPHRPSHRSSRSRRGEAETETTQGQKVPTLHDLIAARPPAPVGPAQQGWQARIQWLTGGLIHPGPGLAEREYRSEVASIQRSLDGPKTIVVVNPKGGGTKTTVTMLLAATLGIHRGGYTLAWDNNETRGTLGWRANPVRHTNTAVDLLRDLERFTDVRGARVGDLDNYVRAQGSTQFDVLASDEDAASAASIDADAFNRLHSTLSRFYRLIVIDTGNNMRASNWQAAVAAADQLVIVSTVREDTAQSAAWLIDALRATGQQDVVERAVTVLTAPARIADPDLSRRLHDHFGALTRTVIDVPHDPVLVPGGPIIYDTLNSQTRKAWLRVSAAVADGL